MILLDRYISFVFLSVYCASIINDSKLGVLGEISKTKRFTIADFVWRLKHANEGCPGTSKVCQQRHSGWKTQHFRGSNTNKTETTSVFA